MTSSAPHSHSRPQEVWARLRYAIETGTLLETLVELTTPEGAVAARLPAKRSATEQEVAALGDERDHARGELSKARARVSELARQVEALRSSKPLSERSGHPLYRRFGLHEDAPA